MDGLGNCSDDNNDSDDSTSRRTELKSDGSNNKDGRKNRLRREIASLHQEMEVTGYAKGKLGHRQRRVPRDVSKVRTQKRKLLEKLDDNERAILGEEDESENEVDDGKPKKKRLRGSRAAAEDSVIRGSLIFQTATGGEDDEVEREEEEDDEDTDIEISEEVLDKATTEKIDEEEGEAQSSKQSKKPSKYRKSAKSSKSGGPSGKKRRKMYRLRNFQSFKMAQKHGDALAAHARGQPGLAIEQLKEVAKGAPSAPQVYSSLGMVY